MTVSPFVERLREHAASVGAPPRTPPPVPAGEQAGERTVAPDVAPNQLAFWQSPIARALINRRITGDPELGPETHFARRHGPAIVAPHALSLRASDAKLELALVEAGSCERLTGIDDDQARVSFAAGRVPEPLRARVRFELGTLERWQPPEPLGAVVCRSFLHRRQDLEAVLDRLLALLEPGGLLFVEDFVGPARFQWTDEQLEVINRLLARLPAELLTDLSASDGRRKRSVERPSLDVRIATNPHEAVRSDEILPLLDARFERVEVCPYGGAVFHQLFSRIMGNFAGRPELIGVLMEVDALLTDSGVLSSDYVWGVWRRG
ncbi:MAG TPA: methyltransferase domain-containing protein [Solirubrobacteraceae bacterium]|jgi:SAM-dependent methyltransferase|nr:methyltransferase domain-containing protein [Solirubrobacteraceae bacterium]